jgi:hypothetical protein
VKDVGAASTAVGEQEADQRGDVARVAGAAEVGAGGGLLLAAQRGLEALGKAGFGPDALVPIAEQATTALRSR